jgi:hypothetical protein
MQQSPSMGYQMPVMPDESDSRHKSSARDLVPPFCANDKPILVQGLRKTKSLPLLGFDYGEPFGKNCDFFGCNDAIAEAKLEKLARHTSEDSFDLDYTIFKALKEKENEARAAIIQAKCDEQRVKNELAKALREEMGLDSGSDCNSNGLENVKFKSKKREKTAI